MKVVIVGGVAGGASAVARIRRLDEHAQIARATCPMPTAACRIMWAV